MSLFVPKLCLLLQEPFWDRWDISANNGHKDLKFLEALDRTIES